MFENQYRKRNKKNNFNTQKKQIHAYRKNNNQ